jgi:hypothetical protein
MVRRTPERRTFRRKRQPTRKATLDLGGKRSLYPEKRKTTGIDIGGWSLGQLSPLERERPTYKILKTTPELELAKQADGMSSGLQRSKHWTVWRGRPPPKRKR